jgi:hypothetical protein
MVVLSSVVALMGVGLVAGNGVPRVLRGIVMPTQPGGDRWSNRGYPPEYKANLPKFASMLDVLLDWNPDNPQEPEGGSKYDTLERLDWQDPEQNKRIFKLRDLEIPFKIYNIPNLVSLVRVVV